MKMLFFSAEGSQVQNVRAEFLSAGIPCEIRNRVTSASKAPEQSLAELWIQNSEDCHRALMLCIRRGIAFSKRALQSALKGDDAAYS